MARTVQGVVDRVREILQDDKGDRYTNLQILAHLIDAIVEARTIRPDLFVTSYAVPLLDTIGLGDAFPLPDQFFAATCYYIAGCCELRDDEFAVDGRAQTLMQALSKKLVSGM